MYLFADKDALAISLASCSALISCFDFLGGVMLMMEPFLRLKDEIGLSVSLISSLAMEHFALELEGELASLDENVESTEDKVVDSWFAICIFPMEPSALRILRMRGAAGPEADVKIDTGDRNP